MSDERCPHCGGSVKWLHLDVGYPEQIRSRYECALGGQCPGLLAKIEQGLPITERCPRCDGTAVRMMIAVPELHQPKPWPMVPGDLVCMYGDQCETRRLMAETDRLLTLVEERNRPWFERLRSWWYRLVNAG